MTTHFQVPESILTSNFSCYFYLCFFCKQKLCVMYEEYCKICSLETDLRLLARNVKGAQVFKIED